MLKFNSYRAKRYLRSRFVEGKYLLASEASDIELELIEALRRSVESTLGSEVAVEDAWEVSKLSQTQLLIKPGEAWFKGLPVNFRSGKDQLVSGAILSEGIVPVGVTFADDASGLGKVITFNNAATTPTNLYKINVTIREELITEVDDPFLQNANLTESTAQKVRLIFQINVVPDSLQTESPIPYRDESSTSGSPTNYPNSGGSAAPNLVNKIVVTPTAAGNGELISLTPITGSEKIDGRDLEIVIRNDSGIGGGIILPNSPTAQLAFSNGTLVDSYGNSYHVNQIFNDTISTQLVIRIDKEPDQPNPQLVNTLPYSLFKRDVYVTDDVNGSPQGKQYWNIATVDWHQVDGFVHQSSVVDLRTVVKKQDEFQEKTNNKSVLTLVNPGSIAWDASTELLTWASAFKFINPSGLDQTITAASVPMVDGGSLVYDLKLAAGGALEKGSLAINVTAFGATSSLSAVDLSTVKVGNVVVDSAGFVTHIIEIDDVNNTITTDAALTANGAATIYKDSYGPQLAPLSVDTVVLAVRNGSKVYLSGLELEDGETGAIGDGVSTQLLAYIGAPDETTSSPTYSSTISISNGDSHTVAIGKLDAAVGVTSAGVNQDRTMKLIAGGTWSWTLGTNTLAWSANAFIEIAGLADTVNQINAGNAVITAGQVAYVDVNRTGPGGSLTVQVGAIASVTPGLNRLIIARRDGNDIIVGNHSMRLIDAESKALYAGVSNQNLAFMGASTEADNQPNYSSDIRGVANESLQARAGSATDAIGDEQEDRSAYLRSDQPVTWSGTSLTFTSDIILEIVNTKSGTVSTHTILAASSPINLANAESAWILINRALTSENVTVNLSGTLVIPAQTQANKDVFVLFRRQDVASTGYLHIPFHKQLLEPGQTVRLGASGSGSDGGNGTLDPVPGYKMLLSESYESTTGSIEDTTNTTLTKATHDAAKKLYQLSVDKSKTVVTSSGTALTINLAPTFTVQVGDIVYLTSGARINQWRRITAVGSQTSFTLDAAFSGGDASGGDTLMVSQAVWTVDLVNYGSASELTRPRDFYPAELVDQILVDYVDSLTVSDAIGDFVSTARVVMSASNEGLQAATGTPLASNFTQGIYTRPTAPTMLPDYILSSNTDMQRLFLVFFANPNNGSVTSTCNLLEYQCNFYSEAEAINGGVLDSAYGISDGSSTPYNLTFGLNGSNSYVDLAWSFNPNADPGGVASQISVKADGQDVPKFISSAVTPSSQLSYTLTTDTNGLFRRVQFNANLSTTPIDIKITRNFGVYDASFTQSNKLLNLYEAIVGTSAQVTAGAATHTSLQAAHDAVVVGSNILVLNNVTLSGNTTLSKRLMIVGKGPGSNLTGNLTVASGALGSNIKDLRVEGNITFNSGADKCFMTSCHQASGYSFSNDPSNLDNVLEIITE